MRVWTLACVVSWTPDKPCERFDTGWRFEKDRSLIYRGGFAAFCFFTIWLHAKVTLLVIRALHL